MAKGGCNLCLEYGVPEVGMRGFALKDLMLGSCLASQTRVDQPEEIVIKVVNRGRVYGVGVHPLSSTRTPLFTYL